MDEIKSPKMKLLDHAFTTPNHNGNLYNTENDRPVNDITVVGQTNTTRVEDTKRLQNTKLGDKVKYYGDKEGTVVGRNGFLLKIVNEETSQLESVPISETFFQDEVIVDIQNQMWNKMDYDMRQAILSKSNIPIRPYVNKDWFDLPQNIKQVLKSGFAGREPGVTRDAESQSFRNVINPKHTNETNDDKTAPALDKSDVEHGMYGGITTDQEPLDATDDYEDKYPKGIPQTSVAQEEIDSAKPSSGGQREDEDPSQEKDEIEYNADPSPFKKFKIVKEDKKVDLDEKEKEGLTTSSSGVMNPVYGETPHKKKSESDEVEKFLEERRFINKHNSRWGTRYNVEDLD